MASLFLRSRRSSPSPPSSFKSGPLSSLEAGDVATPVWARRLTFLVRSQQDQLQKAREETTGSGRLRSRHSGLHAFAVFRDNRRLPSWPCLRCGRQSDRAVGVPIADSHPGSASPPASSVRRRSLCPISFKIHRKMSPCVVFVIVTSFLVIVYCPLSIAYSPLVVTSNAVACL